MKKILRLLPVLALLFSAEANAQGWDQQKYPDYNPTFSNPEPSLLKYGKANTRRKARAMAAEAGLPDHVNNANTIYFPPVINQSGGSCGSASRIYYMFTHEINSYRNEDASTPDHTYPTHFVWLLTYGNSGKDQFVTNVGVPSSKTYGGSTYSSLFGYNDCGDVDFGWMTGYEKWFEAFGNRMTSPTTNPYSLGTEEGRLAAKAWLYNHAGDETYKCGGLIGLGVASGGDWQRIPSTAVNDSIGVSNMYYVNKWGTSVDHALTMVGYDDRIEFDLNGNGVYGEVDKDEVGAWIIVNSWGGWCNDGFIYCPYAYAGTRFTDEGYFLGDWWYGELYHTRKDYRPLRTIKLKMDYSRRSEMLLEAGISADLNATKPEKSIQMHHFRYAGDGHNGDSVPAPEVPMLGRWADGKLHTEPMEFGYDLTDLTSGFDRNQPLKYFFIINTRSTAVGEGNIYEASIMDYENDPEGVETPFDLGESGSVEIQNAGNQTIISVIVYGAALNSPVSLAATNGTLTWGAPAASAHTLAGYNIYKDGEKVTTVGPSVLSYAISESGIYGVTAVYEKQAESAMVTVSTTVEKQEDNLVLELSNSGFSIPDVFDSSYEECTIEFYMRPNSQINYNNAFGPGWGTFYAHCNSTGYYNVGWNTGSHRITSSTKLKTNGWNHVTIVVDHNRMQLYINTTLAGDITSDYFSGIGGFGNLVFSASNNFAQDCAYDEIRIWNKARTAAEVKSTYNREFYGDVMPDGLMAYYKGDLIDINGTNYLRDCVGGHHAALTNSSYSSEVPATKPTLYRPKDTENILSINEPEETIYAGIPYQFSATRGDAIHTLAWNIPAAGIANSGAVSPSATFSKAGQYDVMVTGTDYEADGTSGVAREISDTLTVTVADAPAPDASFTATATEVASGDRVSFHATNPMNGYAYSWSMPGADVESAATVSAGASYQGAGTYTVTLTCTAPNGQTDQQHVTVTVDEVAPEADFTISNPVVLKGESTILDNTSKHKPTELTWILQSNLQKITVNGGESFSLTPEQPGVYDVTLAAANEKGSSAKTLSRGLIVTNADSKNGLSFTQSAATVTLSKPLFEEETAKTLSIDWWMNPSKLSNYCLGMGQSVSSFMLKTDANGTMYLHNGTRVVNSGSGFVIAGQWHHYAVCYNKGTVKFFRDGELIKSASGAGGTISRPEVFTLGTSAAAMTGTIDELRIWNCNLTAGIIESICNQPMDAPDYYVTGEKANYKLLLYYQFNQNSGDVTDLTSNGNTGVRTGFGPDGDAWEVSKGVFCLNFGSTQDDIVIDAIKGVTDESQAASAQNSGTYTLTGIRVNDKAPLRPGLYIRNGKTVLIK